MTSPLEPLVLLLEDEENDGDRADDERAREQGEVEEELQGNGAADDFGEVGGRGDELGLGPHA